MEFKAFHRFLLDRGMAYFYAIFIAGYFLLPSASGHRRVYYFLVLPAVLLLWRTLASFYRNNNLAFLLTVYAGYMMSSLLWTADFTTAEALDTLGYTLSLLSFCFISGWLWVEQPARSDRFTHRTTLLAAAAAVISIVAWYLEHPFPTSRLEPLGVMHHQNKSACAYGIFLVFCMYYVSTERGRDNRIVYSMVALVLLSLIILTQSRTALTATCVSLLVLVGYRALAIFALGSAASLALVATNSREWLQRVENFSFRPGIWEQVLADMQGHWWFGHGYLVDRHVQAYGKVFNHAHNSYLASLRDGGMIGLALLLAILAVAARWAWHLYRQRGERIYLALLSFGMTAVTMDYDRLLVHPKEIWLFFWLPVALIMASYPVRHEPVTVRYPGYNL